MSQSQACQKRNQKKMYIGSYKSTILQKLEATNYQVHRIGDVLIPSFSLLAEILIKPRLYQFYKILSHLLSAHNVYHVLFWDLLFGIVLFTKIRGQCLQFVAASIGHTSVCCRPKNKSTPRD